MPFSQKIFEDILNVLNKNTDGPGYYSGLKASFESMMNAVNNAGYKTSEEAQNAETEPQKLGEMAAALSKAFSEYINNAEQFLSDSQLKLDLQDKIILRETLAPLKAFQKQFASPASAGKDINEVLKDTSWLKGLINTEAKQPEPVNVPESLGKTEDVAEGLNNYKSVVTQTKDKLTEYLVNLTGDDKNPIETISYKSQMMGYVIETYNIFTNVVDGFIDGQKMSQAVKTQYNNFMELVSCKNVEINKDAYYLGEKYFEYAKDAFTGAGMLYGWMDMLNKKKICPEDKESYDVIRNNLKAMRITPSAVGLKDEVLTGLDNSCKLNVLFKDIVTMAMSHCNVIDKAQLWSPFKEVGELCGQYYEKAGKFLAEAPDANAPDFFELDSLIELFEKELTVENNSVYDEDNPVDLNYNNQMFVDSLNKIKNTFPQYQEKIDSIVNQYRDRVRDFIADSLKNDDAISNDFFINKTLKYALTNGYITENELLEHQGYITLINRNAAEIIYNENKDEIVKEIASYNDYIKREKFELANESKKYIKTLLQKVIVSHLLDAQAQRYLSDSNIRSRAKNTFAKDIADMLSRGITDEKSEQLSGLIDRLINHPKISELMNPPYEKLLEFVNRPNLGNEIENLVYSENVLSQISGRSMDYLCGQRIYMSIGSKKFYASPSTELTELRNAITNLQEKIRNIEPIAPDDYVQSFRAAATYLNLKSPSPFSDAGKQRFEAASEILLKFGEELLKTKPEMKDEIETAIKNTLVRSAKFRRTALSSATNPEIKSFASKAFKELGTKDVSTKLKTEADIDAFSRKYSYINDRPYAGAIYGDKFSKVPKNVKSVTSGIVKALITEGKPLPSADELISDLQRVREEARKLYTYEDFRKELEKGLKKYSEYDAIEPVKAAKRAQKERLSDKAASIIAKETLEAEKDIPEYVLKALGSARAFVSFYGGIPDKDVCETFKNGTPTQLTKLFNKLLERYLDKEKGINPEALEKPLTDEELVNVWEDKMKLLAPFVLEFENIKSMFADKGADIDTLSNPTFDQAYKLWKKVSPYYDYYQARLQNMSSEFYSYLPDKFETKVESYEDFFEHCFSNMGVIRSTSLNFEYHYAAYADFAINEGSGGHGYDITGIYDSEGNSIPLDNRAAIGQHLYNGEKLFFFYSDNEQPVCYSMEPGFRMPPKLTKHHEDELKNEFDIAKKAHAPKLKSMKEASRVSLESKLVAPSGEVLNNARRMLNEDMQKKFFDETLEKLRGKTIEPENVSKVLVNGKDEMTRLVFNNVLKVFHIRERSLDIEKLILGAVEDGKTKEEIMSMPQLAADNIKDIADVLVDAAIIDSKSFIKNLKLVKEVVSKLPITPLKEGTAEGLLAKYNIPERTKEEKEKFLQLKNTLLEKTLDITVKGISYKTPIRWTGRIIEKPGISDDEAKKIAALSRTAEGQKELIKQIIDIVRAFDPNKLAKPLTIDDYVKDMEYLNFIHNITFDYSYINTKAWKAVMDDMFKDDEAKKESFTTTFGRLAPNIGKGIAVVKEKLPLYFSPFSDYIDMNSLSDEKLKTLAQGKGENKEGMIKASDGGFHQYILSIFSKKDMFRDEPLNVEELKSDLEIINKSIPKKELTSSEKLAALSKYVKDNYSHVFQVTSNKVAIDFNIATGLISVSNSIESGKKPELNNIKRLVAAICAKNAVKDLEKINAKETKQFIDKPSELMKNILEEPGVETVAREIAENPEAFVMNVIEGNMDKIYDSVFAENPEITAENSEITSKNTGKTAKNQNSIESNKNGVTIGI